MSDAKTFIEFKERHRAYPLMKIWLDRHEQAYTQRSDDLVAGYQIDAYNSLIMEDYILYLRRYIAENPPADLGPERFSFGGEPGPPVTIMGTGLPEIPD